MPVQPQKYKLKLIGLMIGAKINFSTKEYIKSAPIMHDLRSVKHPLEIELLQRACNITEKGFRRVLKFVKAGVMEYEIEAEYMHEFLINRSKGFAYEPIIASGRNACVLHYIDNNKVCLDGDVILWMLVQNMPITVQI